MKNTKFQEFSAGRAGSGRINLATGVLTLTHQTTKPESNILPVSISHVYRSDRADKNIGYGKGIKLNLHQTLRLANDDTDGTKWQYEDAQGETHEFEQRFYHRKDGEKAYVKPSDVKIHQDGKLALAANENVEITQETYS